VLLVVVAGCVRGAQRWTTEIETPAGDVFAVDSRLLRGVDGDGNDDAGVPLERVLWHAGHRAIARLVLVQPEGQRLEFDWPAVADEAWWQYAGTITISDQALAASRLEVVAPALLDQVQVDIKDLAPTAAAALGLRAPSSATGQALPVAPADHVLLLFLDGFGTLRYGEARSDGLVPNLAGLGEPLVGLTEYPPSTRVGTAALLTAAPPDISGVDRRSIRSTESETLFDVATEAGLRVVAVEGESLSFNLRNAEVRLSGDRDGNGSTDDNVLRNALEVLREGMPDLFYVHFHGIDDAGHTYGPGAPEEREVIRAVDSAVGQLIEALPEDTLVFIFADHGMHLVEEDGRLGNHAHLIERDMFIPIFVART
jgi:hypothetical protein